MVESTTVISRKKRFRWSLGKERWYPIVLAGIALLCGFVIGSLLSIKPLLFSASVAFGAIVAGFSGTCLSILMVLDTQTLKAIRRTKVYSILASYLGHSIFSGVFLSVASIGCLMTLNTQVSSVGERIAFAIWCGAVIYCFSCFCRLSIIMLRMFSNPGNKVGDKRNVVKSS